MNVPINKNLTIKEYQIKWALCLLIVAAVLVAYGQVINFDFVGYDDQLYVTDNFRVRSGLTLKGFFWALTSNHDANWFPVTWLSHMLDVELYGLNPMGHHWTNVQLHIANTLLLFFILQAMTGEIWKSAFVAACFALHPLHVESVAWIAERKDVLSTFFGMLMLAAYHRYAKRPDWTSYLLVFLLFVLGLMSKPMLVTFPFLMLLLDFWPLKRMQLTNSHSLSSKDVGPLAFQWLLRCIIEKIPLFVLATVSSVVTFLVQKSEGAVQATGTLPLITRFANALVSYITYITKTVWPHHLAVFYPHPGATLPVWQIYGAAVLIAGAVFLAVCSVKRYPYISVGLFWFLGTLVPVIGLVQVGEQAMADRYAYVPLIGLFIIVAWGVPDLLQQWRYKKIVLKVFALIIVAALTVTTFFQIGHWKNAVTLFEHAVIATKNNYLAQNNLGTALGRTDLDRAIFHYKEALKIKPNYTMALNNLGTALFYQGKYDAAALQFKQALRVDPQSVDAHYNFGRLLLAQGKIKSAITHFLETIKINPEFAPGYNKIGLVLAQQGKYKKANVFFLKAIQINPDDMETRKNLELMTRISTEDGREKSLESALKQ